MSTNSHLFLPLVSTPYVSDSIFIAPDGLFQSKKTKGYRCLALAIWLFSLCLTSAFAIGKTIRTDLGNDSKELIGIEVEGNQYPKGWRAIGSYFFDPKHSLDGDIIQKKNVRFFVLRKILVLGSGITQRRAVVVEAVQIHIDPSKRGQLFISNCKHPNFRDTADRHILVEVRFKRCDRYSSRVGAVWEIDGAAKKISPMSIKGVRCVDDFFNNGPDGPTCPPVAQE